MEPPSFPLFQIAIVWRYDCMTIRPISCEQACCELTRCIPIVQRYVGRYSGVGLMSTVHTRCSSLITTPTLLQATAAEGLLTRCRSLELRLMPARFRTCMETFSMSLSLLVRRIWLSCCCVNVSRVICIIDPYLSLRTSCGIHKRP